MVDKIISVTNVENTKEVNGLINTFIEHKKLKLFHTKCKIIYIGKRHSTCPILKVYDQDMEEADDETYLGDIIDKKGNINKTIEKRSARGECIVSKILSVIKEIPLGKHKVKSAL